MYDNGPVLNTFHPGVWVAIAGLSALGFVLWLANGIRAARAESKRLRASLELVTVAHGSAERRVLELVEQCDTVRASELHYQAELESAQSELEKARKTVEEARGVAEVAARTSNVLKDRLDASIMRLELIQGDSGLIANIIAERDAWADAYMQVSRTHGNYQNFLAAVLFAVTNGKPAPYVNRAIIEARLLMLRYYDLVPAPKGEARLKIDREADDALAAIMRGASSERGRVILERLRSDGARTVARELLTENQATVGSSKHTGVEVGNPTLMKDHVPQDLTWVLTLDPEVQKCVNQILAEHGVTAGKLPEVTTTPQTATSSSAQEPQT